MPEEAQNVEVVEQAVPAEAVPAESVPVLESPTVGENSVQQNAGEAPVSEPQAPKQEPPSVPTAKTETAPAIMPDTVKTDRRSLLQKALEAIQFRKRAKLDKIMKFVSQKGSITNDQAEKLLHVSDSTATRYLSELVKKGSLRRTGTTSGSRYEL